MHSVLWASILASTRVAAVTTLLVECLAKPWLEARKERILQSDRQRRAALNGFKRAAFLAGTLVAYRDMADLSDVLSGRMNKRAADIEEIMAIAI